MSKLPLNNDVVMAKARYHIEVSEKVRRKHLPRGTRTRRRKIFDMSWSRCCRKLN